jgi:soluble lytic murein transglycosylase-like protein
MYFTAKKIMIVFCCCLGLWFPLQGRAQAADVYSVIYNEVSSYNGNPQEVTWITQAILYASSTYGVDPLLITSVMEQESHFVIYGAQSGVGAIGLMQLMPDTAQAIGVDPYNPLDNILGGVIYLKNQLDNFSGWGQYAVTDAVAAYNAGPQAVKKYQGVPPYAETRNYVVCIANNYNRLLSAY